MTLLELKKMMMKAKKEDKIKANALMMLVDTAQKIAKEKGVEADEKVIAQAAKKLVKIAKEEIDSGVEKAKEELKIYEEFLPKALNEEETKKIIQQIIDEIGGKNIGEIMKRLKQRGDVDMALANKIIKEI
ncbi:MAG: GatB/YqeY domain-containing protein [Epsilonproteobacteria bacterium]|nr:GatB/YqeY domain-containing protein [Campylobacterota bacterium]